MLFLGSVFPFKSTNLSTFMSGPEQQQQQLRELDWWLSKEKC